MRLKLSNKKIFLLFQLVEPEFGWNEQTYELYLVILI